MIRTGKGKKKGIEEGNEERPRNEVRKERKNKDERRGRNREVKKH